MTLDDENLFMGSDTWQDVAIKLGLHGAVELKEAVDRLFGIPVYTSRVYPPNQILVVRQGKVVEVLTIDLSEVKQ